MYQLKFKYSQDEDAIMIVTGTYKYCAEYWVNVLANYTGAVLISIEPKG